MMNLTAIVAVFALVGAVAGAAARWLVGSLPRGAPVRPPGCELAVAVLWGGVGGLWAGGALPGGWLPALLGLGWLAAALGAVDLARGRLPDALTLPALPGALLLVVPLGGAAVLRGLAGAGLALGVHAAVRWCAPRAIGGGDVKLAAPLGAVLAAGSLAALVPAAVLASILTAALGLVASGRAAGSAREDSAVPGRVRRIPGPRVPHGPSMLLAAWAVTLGTALAGAGPGLG
ncbi:prepilin peptidase [Pseudonocardia sp.]|uniref:prepilin peptidase n=1 Tax=Pseudonocardia sp. TaxID=60912 RepID=UPI003D11601B